MYKKTKKNNVQLTQLIKKYPQGVSVSELFEILSESVPFRTLQFRLSNLVHSGILNRTGIGRSSKYRLAKVEDDASDNWMVNETDEVEYPLKKYTIPSLPLSIELETKTVLKKLAKAHQALAELKGVCGIIPNQNILISTLSLQEAKDSSAIENIVTTHDELFKSDPASQQFMSYAAKEVYSYAAALQNGFQKVRESGLLINSQILDIQQTLVENNAGYRRLPGTILKNDRTGEVVYSPPQNESEIRTYMKNLERFMNDERLDHSDPLVKMAVIHHQFESIHPFYDGNGRTGRIINILYLVKCGLLDTPVLYLSRFINRNKAEYYRLLQDVRDRNSWEEWVLYILEGVEQTSRQTIDLIHGMRDLIQYHKHKLRKELPKIYSQDLLNNLFRHPYTKIDFVVEDLGISRMTATKYLDELVKAGMLSKHKKGKEFYYMNTDLYNLLCNANSGKN